jgi:hypothetical protein
MSATRRAQRQMIAHRLASRIQAGETCLDETLREVGLLCSELPKMRQEASLSAVFGQDLFLAAGSVYTALVEARSRTVQLHNLMEAARLQLGLAPVSVGGTDKPTDPQQDVAPTGAAA